MPSIYIIAGCNGAGKTTASYTFLPEMLNCREFVNADEIAKGISPFQPDTVSFEAGRIMLSRVRSLIEEKQDFAFETTLSTRSYLPLVKDAKAADFTIVLIFFWLESYQLAIQRVAERVKRGGHAIPHDIIERRYKRGLENLKSFIDVSDYWVILNNTSGEAKLVAESTLDGDRTIFDVGIWDKMGLK